MNLSSVHTEVNTHRLGESKDRIRFTWGMLQVYLAPPSVTAAYWQLLTRNTKHKEKESNVYLPTATVVASSVMQSQEQHGSWDERSQIRRTNNGLTTVMNCIFYTWSNYCPRASEWKRGKFSFCPFYKGSDNTWLSFCKPSCYTYVWGATAY